MKRLGRIAAVLAVVALVAVPVLPAGAAPSAPDIYESSATAGGLHASIAVPAYFEVFGPYAFAEATNGSSHSYEAPGYGGFFLTAAAEQFGFPPPPGTTETLYPQGPRTAGTPAAPVDANVGESSGRSGPDGASGKAIAGRGAFAPAFDVAFGEASASVVARAKAVTSTSSIAMQDIELADGLVSIDQVTGTALSRSTGTAGGGSTDGSIAMTGLRVAGVPVDLRADGVVVAGMPFTLPDSDLPVNDVLSQAGVKIERLPDVRNVSADGQIAEIRVGGIRFTFTQPNAEVTLIVTIGDLVARSRAVDLPDAPAVQLPSITPVSPPLVAVGTIRRPVVIDRVLPSLRVGDPAVRRLVRTEPVGGGDWIAIAALAALAAPLSLLVRRAFRAAARP
jgi:hypothetical protein